MKYFVVFVVFVVLIGTNSSFAQYYGHIEVHEFFISHEGQHEIRLQSSTTKFNDVFYDEPSGAIIISVDSDNMLTDIISIHMNYSSFRALLADEKDVETSDVLVLLDGEEQVYDAPHITNGNVVWEFKTKPNVTEIELILESERYRDIKKQDNNSKYPIPGGGIISGTYPVKKQFEIGIKFENLKCNEGHILIQKHDGSPACVTEQTKQKLIERGWTNNETKNFWKFTSDWNSIKLIRNDNGMYCNSTNEQLSDQCYSLEEIVFRNGFKKYGWKIYPGGGIILPENSTLTPIFKTVEPLGFRQIDLNAMLDDKIFVNKCESNGGIWNYTYHDCEGLIQACNDIGGIYLNDDVTPICNPLDGCDASGLVRVSCVFEYEN
jgi:hypothetical protein